MTKPGHAHEYLSDRSASHARMWKLCTLGSVMRERWHWLVMGATADNNCHGGGATPIESIHVGNLLMKIQLSEVIIT